MRRYEDLIDAADLERDRKRDEAESGKARVEAARKTVLYYRQLTKSDNENAVIDLLADLRHLCDYRDESFNYLDDQAALHYLAEIED